MLRNSADPGSPFIDLVVTPGNGVALQYRSIQNGTSVTVAGPKITAPYWVRLVRTGQVVQGLASLDGVSWSVVGQITTKLGTSVEAGLAVTSHQNGTLATANFSQVAIQASSSNPDSDGNGLPDAWEIQYFGHIGNDPNSLSPAGDGYSLLQEYQMGRNPIDYYQGAAPKVSIVSGNNQSVLINSFAPSPLVVQVSNAGGTALGNAPLSFALAGTSGGLSTTNGGSTTTTLSVRANALGLATVYFLSPGSVGTSNILATAGTTPLTSQVNFTELVTSPPAVLGTLLAGGDSSFVVHADQSLKAWGNDLLGQLGLAPQASVITPTQLADATYLSVSTRGGHSLFLHQDHTVSAVGENYFGQLGTGNHNDLTIPQTVSGLANITQVATGARHSLALQQNGTVLAWGGNWAGQLGSGTTSDALTPSAITGLNNIRALAAGRAHSLALAQDGTVYAWGDNSYGQLGSGNRTNSSTPTQVAGLSQIVAISAGDYFSVALQKSGAVYVWGANSAGQLALGHQHVVLTPQPIISVVNGQAVAAGAEHLVVLDSSGNVSSSGANFSGQLGTGDYLGYNLLKNILSGGAAQIAAGFDHSLALKTDGTVQAWGANQAGQLGDSTILV